MTQTARQGLGASGERLALHLLAQKGYAIVEANWRYTGGELDLIMRDGDVLVFVEVKTRRGERMGAAEESVSAAQTGRLLRAAQTFLAHHPELGDPFWRIDLVAVTLSPTGTVSRVNHFENAIQTD